MVTGVCERNEIHMWHLDLGEEHFSTTLFLPTMATLNFALKQCNKFAVMEMSFLLFIGFASRVKQGHAAKG